MENEPEGGREEIRDHYEGHEISMKTACDKHCQMESPAEDSPAMTGGSREETRYNDYEESDSNKRSSKNSD